MAKRFTDTDIWDKEWFMILSCKHKCLIRFLFDKCDVAGVWSANWMLASSYIGEQVTEQDLEIFEEHIYKISDSKFIIVDFIEFQYGTLSENCKPHQKVILLIKKYNIDLKKIKGYTKGIDRLQEEEEDKEEDKDKEKEEEGNNKKISELMIPKMASEFKKFNADYPEDADKDYPALLKIAGFICKKIDKKFVLNKDFETDIMPYWTHLCEKIPKDKFFRNYSISQVEKHIQSIVLTIQDGNNTNGKSNSKITADGLNKAHAKYFG